MPGPALPPHFWLVLGRFVVLQLSGETADFPCGSFLQAGSFSRNPLELVEFVTKVVNDSTKRVLPMVGLEMCFSPEGNLELRVGHNAATNFAFRG